MDIITVNGKGYNNFFCTGTVLNLDHVEAHANVSSPDGVWVGTHEYPTEGVYLGMPTWFLTNTITGEKRTIWGDNKPIFREPASNGNELDWWRRKIFHDLSSYDTISPLDNYTIMAGPSQPKSYYVIRNDTTSDKRPNTTTCVDDIDVQVPFTATYTFVSCDVDKAPLPQTPSLAPIVLPPSATPPVALVPSEAPIPLVLPAVPVPAPEPVTSVVLPVATPPVISIPVVPVAVAPPPAPSSAVAVCGGVAVALGGLLAALFVV